jgi:hypothetical protein
MASGIIKERDPKTLPDVAWCSWCREQHGFICVSRGGLFAGARTFTCLGCENAATRLGGKQSSVRCSRMGCSAYGRRFMYRSPIGTDHAWSEDCLVCQGIIRSWVDQRETYTEDAWCSWCFEETTHARVCHFPGPIRSLYACTYCDRRTARCRGCADGFARAYPDTADHLCSVCAGVLPAWGAEPSVDTKAKIKRWCSVCVRETLQARCPPWRPRPARPRAAHPRPRVVRRQDLVRLYSFAPSLYACANCHAETIPCACGAATRAAAGAARACLACTEQEVWPHLDRAHRQAARRAGGARGGGASEVDPRAQLRHLEAELFARLASAAPRRVFRRRDVIIAQGCRERLLILIVSGARPHPPSE